MKNLRLGILLLVLFILLASALPIIGAGIYKNFTKRNDDSYVTVYLHDSGETKKMSQNEYLLSVMLSKIDKVYTHDTLCAVAVSLRSASLYLKGACREICFADADYCDCSASNLKYTNREDFVKKHGEESNILISAANEAIAATEGEFLQYKNSYALALVHKSSYITTESSFNAFGREYPYLESVITPEKISCRESYILEADLLKKLGNRFENMESAGVSPSPDIILNRSGRVESVKLYMQEISAEEFTEIFSLKSRCFKIEEAYGGIVIKEYGEGHGVGMSILGAENMCENGFSYHDILLYYFRGCKIVSEND